MRAMRYLVLALAALLAVAFAHPPEWLEATVGAGAALLLLAVGAVPVDVAADQLAALLPVVAFLCAILVVAALCAAEGLFAALGAMVTRAARDRPRRILGLTFVTASLVTATLSLDATVVLLTPVMIAAAATSLVEPRPATFACARLRASMRMVVRLTARATSRVRTTTRSAQIVLDA